MRLALGTAQFGLDYGVANNDGQLTKQEGAVILHEARRAGIDTLDTAIAYGHSEQTLGELGARDWKVITKLPPLPGGVGDVREWASMQLQGSLDRLGIDHLDGLLMHRPDDLLGPHGADYVYALAALKDRGLVGSVGYSIYSPVELEPLCSRLIPDIVQAPFNIIDRRLLTSGWMEKLTTKEVRIHTRSVFLQGLLLMSESARPKWFQRWQHLFHAMSEACGKLNLTPLQLSLGYVMSQPAIERVVVGVDSAKQLRQIVNASGIILCDDFPAISSGDTQLIEPSRWQLQ